MECGGASGAVEGVGNMHTVELDAVERADLRVGRRALEPRGTAPAILIGHRHETVMHRVLMNGTQPSANGSTFDLHPLAFDVPMLVRQRAVLDVAGRFAFEMIPHFAVSEDFVIENLFVRGGSAAKRAPSHGAIVFAARTEQPFVRDAVWLFTRVDFGVGKNDEPVLLPPSRNNPAAFVHIGGCFWIVNATLSAGSVQLDETTLAPGEAAPLGAGALLRLNSREFSIEVD